MTGYKKKSDQIVTELVAKITGILPKNDRIKSRKVETKSSTSQLKIFFSSIILLWKHTDSSKASTVGCN